MENPQNINTVLIIIIEEPKMDVGYHFVLLLVHFDGEENY